MIKRTTIFICVVLLICSTFVACNTNADETVEPQELFNSITQQDIDNAIANPDEFTEEELQYYKSILDPYEHSIGVSGEVSWSDTLDIVSKLIKYYEISPNGFAEFFNKVQNKEAKAVKISENLMFVPADVVEDYIAERFNIDKEAFRNKAWYLDEYDEYVELSYAFNTDMGYGGFYDYSILKVEKSGNIWKFYCSNSYPVYYGNEEIYEEDYAVIVVEHNGENDYKFLCAKGFHEDIFEPARAKFEYPFADGIRLCEERNYAFDESVEQENQNAELASLLYYSARANLGRYRDRSFLISDAAKIDAALSMIGCTTYEEEYSDIWGTLENRAEILPFANEDIFIPKEWVEKAIKQIWGDDIEIYHYNSYGWEYNKDGGIYTPKGTETAKYHLYIHSITKTGNGYVAEVSYLYSGYPGVWGDVEGSEFSVQLENYSDIFADPEVVELAKEQAIYLITAEYANDGKLHLKSSARGWNERDIANILSGTYEAGASNYIGKNTEIVANTAMVSSVVDFLGFDNAFAIYPDGYELVNSNRLNYFVQECKENNIGSVLVLKSGSPLPLYAVLLKFDGEKITRQMFYLINDTLVEEKVEIVTLKETDTMWIFESKDKALDVFPKTDFIPLAFAEEGSMTVDEIAQKLEGMCKADCRVKYSTDKMIYGHDCYYFTYVDSKQMHMGSIYVSKDLQRIFVTEEVNGNRMLLVK